MKVVHCPCGKTVEAETEDAIVEKVEAHVAADHPEMVGKYSREDILSMAHDQ
jgi:hypothetical protein